MPDHALNRGRWRPADGEGCAASVHRESTADLAAAPARGLPADARRIVDLQLEHCLRRSGGVMLWLVGLAGFARALQVMLLDHRDWHVRLAVSGSAWMVVAACLVAAWLGRRRGPSTAAGFVAIALGVLLIGSAWAAGNGVAASGLAGLSCAVLVTGLLVGPRTMAITLAGALAGLAALWLAEVQGWIAGLAVDQTSSPTGHLLLKAAPLLITAWLVWRYTHLHRGMLDQLRNALTAEQSATVELRESEGRLRTLLDNALTSILIFDAQEGGLLYANEQALQRHGCATPADLEQRCLYPAEGPRSRRRIAQQVMRRVWRSGARRGTWRTERADGRSVIWDVKLDRLPFGGQPCVVCFAHDVTARIEAEQALRDHQARLEIEVRRRTVELQAEQRQRAAIIEALPMALGIVDRGGQLRQVNRRFEGAVGCTRHDLVGRRLVDLAPTSRSGVVHRLINGAAAWFPGLVSPPVERQIDDPLLGTRDYLVTSVCLPRTDDGELTMLHLGTDITPLKALEREMRAAKDEAERLAQVKSGFLAHMSHEIRTPLNAILGFAQLGLQRREDEASSRRRFERIHGAGHHLLRLLNDVLDYSRLESGKFAVRSEPCMPAVLAATALDMVTQQAAAKQLRLVHTIAPDLPMQVLLDAPCVQQVLVNLLGNAVKFTGAGEVRLSVRCEAGATPAAVWLCFAVEDTGPGLSAEALQRVFEAFEQADQSVTRHFGGTGLGLAISRRLAEEMGGTLVASSQPGQGACFTLRLPLEEVDVTWTGDEMGIADAMQPAPPKPLAGRRLMVVDDVDINREIIEHLLGDAGAEVASAAGGEQALALAREMGETLDLVIMDVQMPGMDGCEATRRLLKQRPGLPVLALTAHALPEERDRCLSAGMCAHISKPVDAGRLLQAVCQYIDSSDRGASACASGSELPTSRHAPDKLLPGGTADSTCVADGAATGMAGRARCPAWPDLPGFDPEAALGRCGHRTDLLVRLLGRLGEELADADRYDPGIVADAADLQASAHRLKGMAANLALPVLSGCAAGLEEALRAGSSQKDRRDGTVPDVEAAATRLLETIASHAEALRHWRPAGAASASGVQQRNDHPEAATLPA